MPYRRTFRRPIYRRRRFFRRRFRRPRRVPRPMRARPCRGYNFKRTCELANIQTTAQVTPTVFAYQFKLSDLPNITEFTSLFDQYRIRAVKLTFYPPSNTAWTSNVTSMPIGEFYTVLDFDDAGAPTDVNYLNQYQTLKRTYFNRPHSRYFYPRAAQSGMYSTGGVTTGYRSVPNKEWFDCGYPDILYYGLKGAYVIQNSNQVLAETIRVTATYYFQVRMVR